MGFVGHHRVWAGSLEGIIEGILGDVIKKEQLYTLRVYNFPFYIKAVHCEKSFIIVWKFGTESVIFVPTMAEERSRRGWLDLRKRGYGK